MVSKVRWSRLWKEFNTWMDDKGSRCQTCNKPHSGFPSWTAQRNKIVELVNVEVARNE